MSKADEFAWAFIYIGLIGAVATFIGKLLTQRRLARNSGQAFNRRAAAKEALRSSLLDNMMFVGGGVYLLHMPGDGASAFDHGKHFVGFVVVTMLLLTASDAVLGGPRWSRQNTTCNGPAGKDAPQ